MLIVVLCMPVYTFSPETIQMKTWNLPGSIFSCNVLYKRGQKQGNDQDYWPLEQLLVYATQQAPLAIFNSPNDSVGSDCELLTPSLWGQYFSLPHAIFCHRDEPESLMNTFISYILLHMLWVILLSEDAMKILLHKQTRGGCHNYTYGIHTWTNTTQMSGCCL